MKLSLRLRPRASMDHAEAVGCFTANLALPGAGSLAAGRAVGYAQLALTTVGTLVSVISCVTALRWFMATGGEPGNLLELWRHVRWPLFGMGIFLVALVWALITGLQILAAHPKLNAPPRIV
ncbi:MAG TPA: hypothetical protein VHB20_03810 [Verrucomicrobiae bacterium]|jgi:hypothetical protein|nr:hypothetical protein [Verrucomicrobiae bacterium]